MPDSPIDVTLLTASADSFAAALDQFLVKEQKYIEYLRSRQRFFFVTAFTDRLIRILPFVSKEREQERPGGIPAFRRGQQQNQEQKQTQTAPVTVGPGVASGCTN